MDHGSGSAVVWNNNNVRDEAAPPAHSVLSARSSTPLLAAASRPRLPSISNAVEAQSSFLGPLSLEPWYSATENKSRAWISDSCSVEGRSSKRARFSYAQEGHDAFTTRYRTPPLDNSEQFEGITRQAEPVKLDPAIRSISSDAGMWRRDSPHSGFAFSQSSASMVPPKDGTAYQTWDSASKVSSQAVPANSLDSTAAYDNSASLQDLIQRVVRGLIDLVVELKKLHQIKGLSISEIEKNYGTIPPEDVRKVGFQVSLSWVISTIEDSRNLARQLTSSQVPSLKPLEVPFAHRVIVADPLDGLKPNIDTNNASHDDSNDVYVRLNSSAAPKPFMEGAVDGSSRRQSILPDGSFLQPVLASGSRTDTSTFAAHGPQSQRVLPSPSPTSFPQTSSFPFPSSLNSEQFAQSAHLQDLQHQISTKTLALQTLHREHENLLAAFSRQRTRCETLDKKSRVSEEEIVTLNEAKAHMESQISECESQIEQLIKSRDDAHRQSATSNTQYLQIMAMSSRLQAQGAADLKRWKSEKEEWTREKNMYEERIRVLEEREGLRSRDGSNEPSASPTSKYGNTPTMRLQEDVNRLQTRCQTLEGVICELSGEREYLDDVMHLLSSIRSRIDSKSEAFRLPTATATASADDQGSLHADGVKGGDAASAEAISDEEVSIAS